MSTFISSLPMPDRSSVSVPIRGVLAETAMDEVDNLAVEEPLETRVSYVVEGRRKQRAISIRMRTPGHDAELAAGFLFTERLIRDHTEILRIHPCRHGNVVRVDLQDHISLDLARLKRHFYTSSTCGVCGKTSISSARVNVERQVKHNSPSLSAGLVQELPKRLRSSEAIFDCTGGLHASALFTSKGDLICVR